jgi:MinD superfamily P-loop ATPase
VADLKDQIAQEAKELKEAPVIQPIVGQIGRCSICGAVCNANQLKAYDEHLPNMKRMACPNCHPQRSTL